MRSADDIRDDLLDTETEFSRLYIIAELLLDIRELLDQKMPTEPVEVRSTSN